MVTQFEFFVQFQILVFFLLFKTCLNTSIDKIIISLHKMIQRKKLHIDREKSQLSLYESAFLKARFVTNIVEYFMELSLKEENEF